MGRGEGPPDGGGWYSVRKNGRIWNGRCAGTGSRAPWPSAAASSCAALRADRIRASRRSWACMNRRLGSGGGASCRTVSQAWGTSRGRAGPGPSRTRWWPRSLSGRSARRRPDATHWSLRSMAKASGLSHTTIRRIWTAFGLQPHRAEPFQLSGDPLFVEKVRDIIGLYLSPPDRAVVLCVDEKSQIQALKP